MSTPSFSAITSRGNNLRDFLFVPLNKVALQNWGHTLKGKNLLHGSRFFLLRVMAPFDRKEAILEATKPKMAELLSLKVYPFTLISTLL